MSAYDPWVTVWSARDVVHAHLLVTELLSVGIEARVTDEHLSGLSGLVGYVTPGIQVPSVHEERALRVLTELEQRLAGKRAEEAARRAQEAALRAAELEEAGARRAGAGSEARVLPHGVSTIVSGGQTGADQAALLWAVEHGVPTAGWVPQGRLAEDGEIPECIPGLEETDSPDPAVRTRRNVRDSDATLILSLGPLSGGSALTLRRAHELARPVLHLELRDLGLDEAVEELDAWLAATRPARLNVAGPRASVEPGIGAEVRRLFDAAFTDGDAP